MKAWVARRRAGGALLGEAAQFQSSPELLELLVVEITDQGKRRPSRVARVFPAGSRVPLAQLVAPRLVWGNGWDLVLSGVEEGKAEGGIAGVAQSWICRLAPPPYAVGFLARHTHKDGVELRKGALFDRYASSTKGKLAVASVHDTSLGRHTVRADLTRGKDRERTFGGTLVDVELGWMSEERFSLIGFQQHEAYESRPARLVRQGWLCEFEIEEPEDDRRRRKNGDLR
jgi:hypothetical protein